MDKETPLKEIATDSTQDPPRTTHESLEDASLIAKSDDSGQLPLEQGRASGESNVTMERYRQACIQMEEMVKQAQGLMEHFTDLSRVTSTSRVTPDTGQGRAVVQKQEEEQESLKACRGPLRQSMAT